MSFETEKNTALNPDKKDKSRKGDIDTAISPLLNIINAHPSYYTTSSCSGRIILLTSGVPRHECDWLLSSHVALTFKKVRDALSTLPKNAVWLKMEPFIVHICARDLDAADVLLRTAHQAGLKRAGIINLAPKLMLEIMGNDRIEAPIAIGGKMLTDDSMLKTLVKEANKKMRKNIERLSIFTALCKKELAPQESEKMPTSSSMPNPNSTPRAKPARSAPAKNSTRL